MAGTRYLRYILLAFFVTVIIFFVSSSSTPKTINGAQHLISDRIGSMRGKQPPPPNHQTLNQPLSDEEVQHNSPSSEPQRPRPPSPPSSHPPTTPQEPAGLAPAIVPGERVNATFVTLARNSDLWDIAKSIREVEDRFNRKFNYDWVFLNDEEFDEDFKKLTTSLISGKTHYGLIPKEHWSYPEWIDQDKAAKTRADMQAAKVIYGDSESYRHMCRYESGFFFRHPLMDNFKYYWRVEPSIHLYCDIDYDPFKYIRDNNKKYSFVLSLYEYPTTIPTLWSSTKNFIEQYPQHIASNNSMSFLSDDDGETYNRCHFWSNFEIGDLDWLRSPAYLDFFSKLDHDGGFFYERWGDAPVHSIAAGLLLNRSEIHFFEDIAYFHNPFTHCPNSEKDRLEKRCNCDPKTNFDWVEYSCLSRFYKLHDLKLPEGYAPN